MILQKGDALDVWVRELGTNGGRFTSTVVMSLTEKGNPVIIDARGVHRAVEMEDVLSINGQRVESADASGYLQDICELFKWRGGTKAQVLARIERLMAVAAETQKLLYVLYPKGAAENPGQFIGILRLAELVRDVFKTASEMPKGDL